MPAGVRYRPPAFAWGRDHRRKVTVIEPFAKPDHAHWLKSTT